MGYNDYLDAKRLVKGEIMDAMEVIKKIAANTGKPITHIGLEMGKRANYVSVAINKGTNPSTEVMARMLEVCGYGLYAIPLESAPMDALRITAQSGGAVEDPPTRTQQK